MTPRDDLVALAICALLALLAVFFSAAAVWVWWLL